MSLVFSSKGTFLHLCEIFVTITFAFMWVYSTRKV